MASPSLTRPELLDRLYATFSRYGYEGASMTRIAEATGLGKASLYHHFPQGKREMAAAVLDHVHGWYEENVFRPLVGVTPPRLRLSGMLDALGRRYANGDIACLPALLAQTEERSMFSEAIGELFRRMIASITQTLSDAGLSRDIAQRRARDGAVRIQGALSMARALNDSRIYTAVAAELPDQLLAGADRSALWTARGAPRFPAPPPLNPTVNTVAPAAASPALVTN
ncbi:MAG TPA: TetR/AcrR family transcriptional regulator [Magnetospirillaceae bacterium]|jgi:AcrR family transcriptional regulator